MAKKKNQRRGPRTGGGNAPSTDAARTDAISDRDMHNSRFEKYYKAQEIFPEGEEWDALMRSLRSPLPTTFRLTGSRQTARVLNELFQTTHAQHLQNVVFEGETIPPPAQIPWYPDGLAWQFNVDKKVIRRSPEFKKFQSFLVYETEIGNISRQEAVSMIPPLLLDVEPHHLVIDMCAAPGSKTAQLLEALHARDSLASSSMPPGLLIANDSDNKRAHLLIHQSARLPSPSLMVTNFDASIYPSITVPPELAADTVTHEIANAKATGTKPTPAEKRRRGALLFDRILCDVPCSGDGTIRKNTAIWKTWNPADGNGLHGLQCRILQRAMRMLKYGGRLVYSTCSLNPVENEAVIAASLWAVPGFELVDVSNRLTELVRSPGVTTWRVAVDRDINTGFDSFEDYLQSLPEEKRATVKLGATHWPPSSEDAEKLGLAKCLRIYPHHQDTGGFFVAVLEKKLKAPPTTFASSSSSTKKRGMDELVDETIEPDTKKPRVEEVQSTEQEVMDEDDGFATGSVTPEEETTVADGDIAVPAPNTAPARVSLNKYKKPRNDDGSYKEHPYTFLNPDDPNIKLCVDQLRLDSSFPTSNILARNPHGEPVRSLYLANDLVRAVVQNNDPARLRLLTAGTKLFSKQGSESSPEGQQFRILSEGVRVALPFIDPTQIVESGNLAALKTLLQAYYPLCSSFSDPFRSDVEGRAIGSYITRFPPEQYEGATIVHELLLPLWKSNVSVSLMIDKQAKSALSMRLFGEDVTVAGQAAAKSKEKAALNQIATVGRSEAAASVTPVVVSKQDGTNEIEDELE